MNNNKNIPARCNNCGALFLPFDDNIGMYTCETCGQIYCDDCCHSEIDDITDESKTICEVCK